MTGNRIKSRNLFNSRLNYKFKQTIKENRFLANLIGEKFYRMILIRFDERNEIQLL
jgi:hypothetical protein